MKSQCADLVTCINAEVRALAQAGCRYIQIDEPLLVREPDVALDFGIDYLAKCFEVRTPRRSALSDMTSRGICLHSLCTIRSHIGST